MRHLVFCLACLIVAPSTLVAQKSECALKDLKSYYGHDLDKEYKSRGAADFIAKALYQGPLMREGDPSGVSNMRRLFFGKDIDIRRVESIVKSHVYDSEEFSDLLRKLTSENDPHVASDKIRDSIYRAFGFTAKRPSEPRTDSCLIRTRQAHFVVTRVLVDYMDRKKLD